VYFKLNTEQENYLLSQPENGMGYQIIKVILKNDKVLHQHKVINSSLLMLEKTKTSPKKTLRKLN
jgi:hypothetical protein